MTSKTGKSTSPIKKSSRKANVVPSSSVRKAKEEPRSSHDMAAKRAQSKSIDKRSSSRKRIAIKLETKARSRRSVAKESSPVKQKTSSTPQRKDQQRRTVKKRPVYSSGSESCEQDDA